MYFTYCGVINFVLRFLAINLSAKKFSSFERREFDDIKIFVTPGKTTMELNVELNALYILIFLKIRGGGHKFSEERSLNDKIPLLLKCLEHNSKNSFV